MDPIESALDVAATILRAGGPTDGAERAFLSVLRAHGGTVTSTVWRLDFIAASGPATEAERTYVRLVPAAGVNLAQAAGAISLAERVGRGDVATRNLSAELEKVQHLGLPYAPWVRILAAAGCSGSFALLSQLGWTGAGIAAVAGAAGQTLRTGLQQRGLPFAQVVLLSGAFTTLIAGVAVRAVGFHWELQTLVASAIFMVPGIPLINGYLDLVSHRFMVVGLERIASAIVVFLILAIVIALAYVVI